MPRIFNSPEVISAQNRRAVAIRRGRTEEADRLGIKVLRLKAVHFRELADQLDREADGMTEPEKG
ncbi:hypothetical protein OG496_05255 [Streptomyces sp. NBC_00988]|uniref:hypothetical protein n=1 Tax=Streptomyces sp. NBC_00988 TaxID=2903704 RepID=UPI0038670140|nr:hypothetical protein OG496_05255 [Streptomyces sp. NBC_00988]